MDSFCLSLKIADVELHIFVF